MKEIERGGRCDIVIIIRSAECIERSIRTTRAVPTQYTMVVAASRLPYFFYLTNALPFSRAAGDF